MKNSGSSHNGGWIRKKKITLTGGWKIQNESSQTSGGEKRKTLGQHMTCPHNKYNTKKCIGRHLYNREI